MSNDLSNYAYIIDTEVKVGASARSKGWALNLKDLQKTFPNSIFKYSVWISVNNIVTQANLMITYRFFYSDLKIQKYLSSLEKIDSKIKIPLTIKIPNNDFLKKEINNVVYIDTDVLVGLSYKNKGWALKNNDINIMFPFNIDTGKKFSTVIDNIETKGFIDCNPRLFYKNNDDLIKELKRLHDINPKQRIKLRIFFDKKEMDNFEKNKLVNVKKEKSNNVFSNTYDDFNKNTDEKIAINRLRKILAIVEPEVKFYEEDLINAGFSKREINISLYKLEKYNLIIKKFDGSIILKDKDSLDNFIKKWE